jgi:hypothetical protein
VIIWENTDIIYLNVYFEKLNETSANNNKETNLVFDAFPITIQVRVLTSSCLSVCLFAWNNSAPNVQIIIKCDMYVLFQYLTKKIQLLLKSDTKKFTLHEDFCVFMVICLSFLLGIRHIPDNLWMQNQSILYSIYLSTFVPHIKEYLTLIYSQTGHMCQHNTAQLLC